MDNNQSEHAYPRNGDPAFGTTRAITAIGTSTQDITNATYDPVSGKMVITTSGNHGLVTGNRIKLAANSLTFTCTMDSNGSNHTYPRATDRQMRSGCLSAKRVIQHSLAMWVLLQTITNMLTPL